MIGISRDEIAAVARKYGYPSRVLEALSAQWGLPPEAAATMWRGMPGEIIEAAERFQDDTIPIDEAVAHQQESLEAQRRDQRRRRPELIRASSVKVEPVAWLWDRRLARGKLSIVAGDPGVSKSTVVTDIAARTTRGDGLPDGGRSSPGNVII